MWFVGVLIYITGALGQSYGANLQRQDERLKESEAQLDTAPKTCRSLRGVIAMAISGTFMSLSLLFAAQTQIAPLCLCMFAGNFFFAYWINDEPFDPRTDGLCILVVTLGVLLCLLAAPKTDSTYDEKEMWQHLILSPTWITFAVAAPALIFGMICLKTVLSLRLSSTSEPLPWTETALNMCWGALPGSVGGVNITLSKTLFSLIIGQFNNHDHDVMAVLECPTVYVVGLSLGTTFLLQNALIVDGLKACTAITVMSTFAVSEMIVAICGGIFCFHDFNNFTAVRAATFAVGVLVAVTGVVMITRFRVEVNRTDLEAGTHDPLIWKPDLLAESKALTSCTNGARTR